MRRGKGREREGEEASETARRATENEASFGRRARRRYYTLARRRNAPSSESEPEPAARPSRTDAGRSRTERPSLHAHDRELDLFDFGELPLFVAQRTVASRAEPLGDAVQVEDVSAVSPRDAQALVRGDRGVRLVLDRGLVQAVPANRARVRADGPRPDRDGVPLRGRAGGGGGARSFEFRDLARARGGGAGLGGGAREEERARARTFLTSKRRFSATSVMLGAKGGRGGEGRRAPRSALKQKSSQHGGETTNSDCTEPGERKKKPFFLLTHQTPPTSRFDVDQRAVTGPFRAPSGSLERARRGGSSGERGGEQKEECNHDGDRTRDRRLRKSALYPLSYAVLGLISLGLDTVTVHIWFGARAADF